MTRLMTPAEFERTRPTPERRALYWRIVGELTHVERLLKNEREKRSKGVGAVAPGVGRSRAQTAPTGDDGPSEG